MKRLLAFSLLLVFLCAPASAISPLAPQKSQQSSTQINIINGKKFFSLGNVRRFNGSTNTPKAMSIVHHPLQQAAVPSAPRSPYIPGPPAASIASPAMGKNASDQVLSVFAPDDKRIPPVPSR